MQIRVIENDPMREILHSSFNSFKSGDNFNTVTLIDTSKKKNGTLIGSIKLSSKDIKRKKYFVVTVTSFEGRKFIVSIIDPPGKTDHVSMLFHFVGTKEECINKLQIYIPKIIEKNMDFLTLNLVKN